jgi:hypothetical protein
MGVSPFASNNDLSFSKTLVVDLPIRSEMDQAAGNFLG